MFKYLNNDNKIWDNKLINENLTSDKNYVQNLNQWEENTFENNDDKKKNDKK